MVEFLEENPNIEFILTKKEEGNDYIIRPNIEIFKIKSMTKAKDNTKK